MRPLLLSDNEVRQFHGIASCLSPAHSIVQRAKNVVACGAGETNTAIAKRMGLSVMTVGKWRKRYRELQTTSADGSTQWSALRRCHRHLKITAHHWLHAFSDQTHRQRHHRYAENWRLQEVGAVVGELDEKGLFACSVSACTSTP
jgi:transposase